MLFPWLRHALCRPARRRDRCSRQAALAERKLALLFRPTVEWLEPRTVPAILPGFNSNIFPDSNPGLSRDQVVGGRTDDGSSGLQPLGFTDSLGNPMAINFFGNPFSSVFVNCDGDLTFGGPSDVFTPSGLQGTGANIIAPFFADVDTRLPAGGNPVMFGTGTVDGHQAFGATWSGVGYFDATALQADGVTPLHNLGQTNSFQVILIDRSDTGVGNFDIEFNYDQITWETGDASGGHNGLGGTSAYVGYSNGTDAGTFQFLGSGVPGSFLDGGPNALVANSNTGVAGRYLFAVRNGQVDQPLTPGTGASIDVQENGTFTGPVAAFSDGDPNGTPAQFAGSTIDWGDGAPGAPDVTPVAAGDVTLVSAGNPATHTPAQLSIAGTHRYTEGGKYTVTVHVVDSGGSTTDVTGTAVVHDATINTAVGSGAVTGVEGEAKMYTLMGFTDTDTGSPAPGPNDFLVKVDWGDGLPVDTVTPVGAVAPGFFSVGAIHAFARTGNFTVHVTITDLKDKSQPPQTVTADVPVSIDDAQLTGTSNTPTDVVEGQGLIDLLGVFTDDDLTKINLTSNYTVTVDWGDSTTSSTPSPDILVSPNPDLPTEATFGIVGKHTYQEDGPKPVKIVIVDNSGGPNASKLEEDLTINVVDAPLTASGVNFTTYQGKVFSGTVATFTDQKALFQDAGDFSGTIDWGEPGSTPTPFDSSNVSQPGGPGTPFVVSGVQHTYASAGTFTVKVTVNDAGGASAPPTTATATVHAVSQRVDFDVVPTVDGTAQKIGHVIAVTQANDPEVIGGARFTLDPAFAYLAGCFNFRWVQVVTKDTAGVAGHIQWHGADAPVPRIDPPEGGYDNNRYDHPEPWYYTPEQEVVQTQPDGSIRFTIGDAPDSLGGGLTFQTWLVVLPRDVGSGDFTVLGGFTWATGVNGGPEALAVLPTPPDLATINQALHNSSEGDPASPLGHYAGWTAVSGTNISCHNLHAFGVDPAISATRGVPFTRTVATFTDDHPNPVAGDYTATITWEDGTTSTGTIRQIGPNLFAVIGTHTPPVSGDFTYSVLVTHTGGANAGVTAPINIHNLSAFGVQVAAVEGEQFSGPVATFADSNPNEPEGSFRASITWGDGSKTDGVIAPNGGGSFTVTGTHTYDEQNVLPVDVTITDQDGDTAVAPSAAVIADAALTSVGTPTTLNVVEGASTGRVDPSTPGVVVATFTDRDPGAEIASDPGAGHDDFTASIAWGDGTSSVGTVRRDPGNTSQFQVLGTHQYPDESTAPFTVTVTVDDEGGAFFGNSTVVATNTTVLVGDAPLLPTVAAIAATEGVPFSGTVGTFQDVNPFSTAADFTATITWGDGTTTPGVITQTPTPTANLFTVSGTHLFGEEGARPVSVLIADVGGQSTTIASTATIADAALTAGTPPAVLSPAEGTAFSGPVFTFTDANPAATAADFTATITWGDGTSSPGTVVAGSGGFAVLGGHTYAEEGNFQPSVLVKDAGGKQVGGSLSAGVADAPVTLAVSPVNATAGSAFSGPVGTLTDANAGTGGSELRVTITWGDGHTSAGSLVPQGNGTFQITGSNTYAAAGSFTVSISVSDSGGGSASGSNTAQVAAAPGGKHHPKPHHPKPKPHKPHKHH